jgi:hypothetical protein
MYYNFVGWCIYQGHDAMMWQPSSIRWQARFVTAGVIDLRRHCTCVPLGQRLSGNPAKTKNTKSAMTPEVMAGLAPNDYHGYI